jgi:hypothetical protein
MEGMSELKACPNCNNVGYYVVEDINGEAEQVQCQFCYTEPNSVFNAVNALNEQITKQSALIEMLGEALDWTNEAESYFMKDVPDDIPTSGLRKAVYDALSAYTLWKKENGK